MSSSIDRLIVEAVRVVGSGMVKESADKATPDEMKAFHKIKDKIVNAMKSTFPGSNFQIKNYIDSLGDIWFKSSELSVNVGKNMSDENPDEDFYYFWINVYGSEGYKFEADAHTLKELENMVPSEFSNFKKWLKRDFGLLQRNLNSVVKKMSKPGAQNRYAFEIKEIAKPANNFKGFGFNLVIPADGIAPWVKTALA